MLKRSVLLRFGDIGCGEVGASLAVRVVCSFFPFSFFSASVPLSSLRKRAPQTISPDHVTSLQTRSAQQPLLHTTPPSLRLRPPPSLPLDRSLFPSHPRSPSHRASTLAAEDTRVALPSLADVTSTRRLESCHSTSYTTCTAPRKSSPRSGPYFCWIRILLIYVYLTLFRTFLSRLLILDLPLPLPAFPLTLAFCY